MPSVTKTFWLLGMLWSTAALAETSVGQVVFVKGEASVIRIAAPDPQDLHFGDEVFQMDTLQTGDGELKVLFTDKTLLSLSPGSKVLITEHLFKPGRGERRSLFDILSGSVRTLVDQPVSLRVNEVKIQTPTAVAGIRGTDVGTRVLPNRSQFFCFDGRFEVALRADPSKRVLVDKGSFTEIGKGPPAPPKPIPSNSKNLFSADFQNQGIEPLLRQSGEERADMPDLKRPIPILPLQPPPTPLIPPLVSGGGQSTPAEAVDTKPAATSGPVKVPVTFPGGAR